MAQINPHFDSQICLDPNLIDFPDQRISFWVIFTKSSMNHLKWDLYLLISRSLFLNTLKRKSYLIGSMNCYFRAHLQLINGNFSTHPRTRDFVTSWRSSDPELISRRNIWIGFRWRHIRWVASGQVDSILNDGTRVVSFCEIVEWVLSIDWHLLLFFSHSDWCSLGI